MTNLSHTAYSVGGKKKRTLVFFSSALLHEHSQKGHFHDDSVPSPRERIYLELYHPSTQYFSECDTPAVTHGQSSLLQSWPIGSPQIIPRVESYLCFRTPANSFEEAFWSRNIACEESEEGTSMSETKCKYLLAGAQV